MMEVYKTSGKGRDCSTLLPFLWQTDDWTSYLQYNIYLVRMFSSLYAANAWMLTLNQTAQLNTERNRGVKRMKVFGVVKKKKWLKLLLKVLSNLKEWSGIFPFQREILSAIFLRHWVCLKHLGLITAGTLFSDIIECVCFAIINILQWTARSYGTGMDKSRVN